MFSDLRLVSFFHQFNYLKILKTNQNEKLNHLGHRLTIFSLASKHVLIVNENFKAFADHYGIAIVPARSPNLACPLADKF